MKETSKTVHECQFCLSMIRREIRHIKKTQAMLNKKLEDTELATEQARAEGKKLGIKEVVDWIENNKQHINGFPIIDNQVWQVKLKEWGIEQ